MLTPSCFWNACVTFDSKSVAQQQEHRCFFRLRCTEMHMKHSLLLSSQKRRGPCLLILIRHGVCRRWRSPPGRRLSLYLRLPSRHGVCHLAVPLWLSALGCSQFAAGPAAQPPCGVRLFSSSSLTSWVGRVWGFCLSKAPRGSRACELSGRSVSTRAPSALAHFPSGVLPEPLCRFSGWAVAGCQISML